MTRASEAKTARAGKEQAALRKYRSACRKKGLVQGAQYEKRTKNEGGDAD